MNFDTFADFAGALAQEADEAGYRGGQEVLRHYSRRWYDQIAHMTLAIHMSRELPDGIQKLVAKNLNQYIDTYRRMSRADKNAVSLGVPRVLGLYRASYRNRWYDSTLPDIHRAFTMMTTVPERFLSEYAQRVIDVANYVEHQRTDGRLSDHAIVDTVDGILNQSYVSLAESEEGFRVAPHMARRQAPQQPNHTVSTDRRKERRPRRSGKRRWGPAGPSCRSRRRTRSRGAPCSRVPVHA